MSAVAQGTLPRRGSQGRLPSGTVHGRGHRFSSGDPWPLSGPRHRPLSLFSPNAIEFSTCSSSSSTLQALRGPGNRRFRLREIRSTNPSHSAPQPSGCTLDLRPRALMECRVDGPRVPPLSIVEICHAHRRCGRSPIRQDFAQVPSAIRCSRCKRCVVFQGGFRASALSNTCSTACERPALDDWWAGDAP